jgi:hypothetical protein
VKCVPFFFKFSTRQKEREGGERVYSAAQNECIRLVMLMHCNDVWL